MAFQQGNGDHAPQGTEYTLQGASYNHSIQSSR